MTRYLIICDDTVMSECRPIELASEVARLIDLGYTTGRIDNQDGGRADLAEWIRDNPERIETAREDRAEKLSVQHELDRIETRKAWGDGY